MAFHISHLKKYYRWFKNTQVSYKNNCTISREYAKICRSLDWAMLLNRSEADVDEKAVAKHEWILSYIKNLCPETITRYSNMQAPDDLHDLQKEVKVWSMWWQGEEKADKLFRMCIDSARRHTHHDVIVLDQNNYKDYFDIPEHMLKKHSEGKIALQHICDFMVVSILAAQGGFFTGATVWWSQDKDDEFLRTPYFTPKAASNRPFFMSRSRWTGYLLAGNKDFPLFSFARDCLSEYWRNADKAVDYLMLDYVFELAYQTIPCVKEMIDELPDNNLLRNEMIGLLGKPFNEDEYKKYTEGDTFIYKLSWKFGNKDLKTPDGKETYYAHLLNECDIHL